jgi:hypothetical protein
MKETHQLLYNGLFVHPKFGRREVEELSSNGNANVHAARSSMQICGADTNQVGTVHILGFDVLLTK